MNKSFLVYILLVIIYIGAIHFVDLFIPVYERIDNFSLQVYPNAPHIKPKSFLTQKKKSVSFSNSSDDAGNYELPTTAFPSDFGSIDFSTQQFNSNSNSSSTYTYSRINSPSTARAASPSLAIGSNLVVLSQSANSAIASSNSYNSSYSFDDNNSFTTMQRGSQAGSAVLDPDNVVEELPNALPLDDEVVALFVLLFFYFLSIYFFKRNVFKCCS